jgi:hypothetical protein
MTTARFLSLFGDRFTFQTFGEGSAKGKRELSRVMHGTLREHAATLADLNEKGAGVFFMVNAGDGLGRKAGNAQQVRALFVDLDGSPLAPVQAATLPPHNIVESSPGRWHAYWRVADCPLDKFKALQQALAKRFDADCKVCDLPRVMRLPGFDHRKATPFTTRVLTLDADRAPFLLAELVQAFDLHPAPVALPARTRVLPNAIPEGERNGTLLSLAAGLVRKGYDAQAVNDRLHRINAERCDTPLCASEVDTIAARAIGYGSDGFVKLPHKLLDSPQWKALPPPAHDVIVIAFRRFDGGNNGNIALTWADFDGRPGFTSDKTFYRQRQRAIDSGILRVAMRGGLGQSGRKPDLFAIADAWLPTSASGKNDGLRIRQKTPSYIDKQFLGVVGSREGKRRNAKSRTA